MTLDELAARCEMWPVSNDPRTQNQVAAILLLRELRRIAKGEPTEPERRARAAALRAKASEKEQE